MARLLLIDDDDMLRTILEEVLSQEGFDVAQAHDVPTALRQLAVDRFDLILSDLLIGPMGRPSLDQLQALQDAGRGSPTVVITGYQEAQELQLADYGVKAIILKPFRLDEFLAALHAVRRDRCSTASDD